MQLYPAYFYHLFLAILVLERLWTDVFETILKTYHSN